MDTCPPPHQPDPPLDLDVDLPRRIYYQLVHSLTADLPPPVADTQEALLARNHAAIAQVAALLPVNAHEAGLAAQCVAARAQAQEVMRLLRVHAGDIKLTIKLNAQYVAMSRTSLGAHGHLLRAQAVRHKREQSDAALSADEWTQHIATRSMQQALDAGPVPATPGAAPAVPAQAGAEPPASAPQPAPAAHPPAPVLAAAPPQAPASEDQPAAARVSAPAANEPPAPAAPVPPAAPPRSRRMAAQAEPDEPPRNLPTEAEHYALVYPRRAREIRHHGGLPPDCSFGPPDDDLVRAIVNGRSPTLRALDGPNATTA
jgi:hypothetical protein